MVKLKSRAGTRVWLFGSALGCGLVVTAAASSASAAHECGAGASVLCPVGAYAYGIQYAPTGDFTLNLAPGVQVIPGIGFSGVSIVGSTGAIKVTSGAGSQVTTAGDTTAVYASTTSGTVDLDLQKVLVTRPSFSTFGDSYGILAVAMSGGDLKVRSAQASVVAYGGSAVAAVAAGGGSVDITSGVASYSGTGHGAIWGESTDVGGTVSITSGTLTGTTQIGIRANAHGDATVVSDTIKIGYPSGYGVAIMADSAVGDVSVTSKSITTFSPYMTGIQANAAGSGSVTIKGGDIGSIGTGILATATTGAIAITSGTIAVTGNSNFAADPSLGILAQTTDGDITINANVTHNASVGFTYMPSYAVYAASTGSGDVTIKSVDASTNGWFSRAVTGYSASGAVVINSGKALATNRNSNAVAGDGASVTIVSQDAETTSFDSSTIAARASAGDVVVTSGRAVSRDFLSKGIDLAAYNDVKLTITGETTGTTRAVLIAARNRADVTVAAGGSVIADATGPGGSFGYGSYGVMFTDWTGGGGQVAGYGASLTTAGRIAGTDKAVVFSGGADTLTVLAGASFGGAIEGGAGVDTLILNGAGQASAQSLDTVTGFETAMVKAGQFTLNAATSFDTTTITGGKLIVAQALSSAVTVQSGGTLQIGTGGATGALTGDLVLNGTAIFNRSDEYDYAGDITGTGELIKQGAQRLVLSGVYGFTGTTTVQGGTVRILHLPHTANIQVDNGLLDLSGLTQTVTNLSGASNGRISIQGGALTVNQAGASTFSGAITGSGSFTVTGGGVIDLAGANTYTGDTTVSAGKLKVNGSIVSDVTVGSAGLLGGSGTINGDVLVQRGGQVTPGNSPGTLHVAGDFTFATGSVYQAEVLPTGEHDLIDVTGVTTIQSGVTVQVLAGGPSAQYARLSRYGILNSAGGVVGKFAGVTSNMAFLTPSLTYTATAVQLTLLRNDVRFASLATTPNQAGTARAAEAQGFGSALYDALVTQSAGGAARGYDALDGQIHADVSTLLAGDAGRLRDAVQNRASAPADAIGGWGDVLAGWSHVEAGAGAAGLKTASSGLVVGGDALVGATRIGVAAAYDDGRATVSTRGSQADATSGQLAAYAASTFGSVHASLGGGYAWSSVDTVRAVSFPGVQDRLKSKYDAKTAQLFAQVSAPMTYGAAVLEPFVSGAWLSVKNDDAVEAGGFTRLNVEGVKRELGLIDLGVKLNTEAGFGADGVLRPHASIAWRMTTGDLAGETSNAFVGGVNRFLVTGAKTDAGAVALQLGTDLVSGDRARFGVTYDATYGGRYEAQAIRAGGAWRF